MWMIKETIEPICIELKMVLVKLDCEIAQKPKISNVMTFSLTCK